MTKTPTPEQHAEQSAVFSRGRNGTTAELRGDVPRSTLDVLDAVSIARGYPSRMALVNEILGNWADKVVHESSLVQRVIAGNPHAAEPRGGH